MKYIQTRFARLSRLLPGIALSFAAGIPAWFAGKTFPIIGGAVFAIIAGIIAAAALRPRAGKPGIGFVSKKFLQWSIILLGFGMNIETVVRVGSGSLIVMAFTLSASFATAALFRKILKIPGKQAALIGIGTCICGSSAIAAAAPVIGADEHDVAQSISTIFLFNIAAVFLFPALGRLIGLSDFGFGLWAGTAINDTSSVVAAASAWSEAAGTGDALEFAAIVKLTRTLLIIPVTVALSVYMGIQSRKGGTRGEFNLMKIFPWFVVGFLAAALTASFSGIDPAILKQLEGAGKFMIVVAMAAIGLSTDFKRIAHSGWKPIALGLACWFAVSAVSLAVQGCSGYL